MPDTPCWPRETLKDYLNGSADDFRLTAIESHLAQCPTCEQTVCELERDPNTLLMAVRREVLEQAPDASQANSHADSQPSIIKRALNAARGYSGTTSASSGPLEKPGKIGLQSIGAYELIRPLGRGGMGLVMLAQHVALKKLVAIKILPSLIGDRPELVRRFQREIITAGQLNHPSIVHATDAGAEQGTHYLVMEYIDGLDISRMARLAGSLSVADACELMRQTALGLSYAHSRGVVHRDIKPSNLMLDTTGRVKILDFGLAQFNLWDDAAVELTTVGQLMGTLDYMAPEQAERVGPVDYRADLYALGATLFRLLTGRAPLAAAPQMTLLEKVRQLGTQTAPLVSTLREGCPVELVRLIERLLSREPAERPASAAHVAEALQPMCAGHDVNSLLLRCRERAAIEPKLEELQLTGPLAALTSERPTPPRRKWLALAWLAPLAILAGVLITLETQKGQLVIESDVASVRVNVLQDGKVYQQLKVQTGAQSTRLFADKYSIEIDGGSEEVVIDQSTIEVRRGSTVVARVSQKPTALTQPASTADPLVPPAGPPVSPLPNKSSTELEPTFAGQTLPQWLKILERDLDSKTRLETLPAIIQLSRQCDDATRQRINLALTAAIKSVIPMLRTSREESRRSENPTPSRFVSALRQINGPERGFELLRTQVLIDSSGKINPTSFLLLLSDSLSRDLAGEARKWLMDDELLNNLDAETAPLAMEFFENCLTDQPDEFVKALPGRIRAQPHLGLFALLKLRPPRDAVPRGVLFDLEKEILKMAREAMRDEASSPQVIALAAARLALSNNNVDAYRDELIESLKGRLLVLANAPDRLLSALQLESTNTQSSRIPADMLEPIKLLRTIEQQRIQGARDYFVGSEILCMLALVERLKAARELDEQLAKVASAVFAKAEPLRVEFVRLRGEQGQQAAENKFAWPFPEEQIRSAPDPLNSFSAQDWRAVKIASDLNDLRSSLVLLKTRFSDLVSSFNAQVEMEAFDKDGDLKISNAENTQYFNWGRDLNRDKLMTIEELIADQEASLQFSFVRELVERLDSSRDRFLSKVEAIPAINESAFAEMDANSDDKISISELANYRLLHPEMTLKPKKDTATITTSSAADAQRNWAERQIAKYDKNKDGSLTVDEWSSMIIPPNPDTDTNRDGRITVEEMVEARRR